MKPTQKSSNRLQSHAPVKRKQSDVVRIGKVWAVRTYNSKTGKTKLTRIPTLAEGYPGGKAAYDKLGDFARRMYSTGTTLAIPVRNPLELLTEQSFFRIKKILREKEDYLSRGIKDAAKQSDVHQANVLRELNAAREANNLGPLSLPELLAYRPESEHVNISALANKTLQSGKRNASLAASRAKLSQAIRNPSTRFVRALRTRIQTLSNEAQADLPTSLQKGPVAAQSSSRKKEKIIVRMLKKPAKDIIRLLRQRVRKLERIEKSILAQKSKQSARNTPVDSTSLEWDVVLRRRFNALSREEQRDARQYLGVAQKALRYYFQNHSKGKTDNARKAIEVVDRAMAEFWKMFPKT